MWTVDHAKFVYAAVNHVNDLSGNKCDISERSTGRAPGLWMTDFDPFCLFLLLDDPYDNDWWQCETLS